MLMDRIPQRSLLYSVDAVRFMVLWRHRLDEQIYLGMAVLMRLR